MSNYKGVFIEDQQNNSWNIAFDMVKRGSQVLDVGCSNGNFGKALMDKKHCQVDGIEMANDDFVLASNVLNKVYNLSVEDFIKNKNYKEKYDSIVFLDVIEHLTDPVAVLKKIKLKLKKGGRIIFSIPNMAHISVRLMLMSGEFDYGDTGLLDNTHLHFYTKKEIERIFAQAGFNYIDFNRTEILFNEDILDRELKKIGIVKISKSLKGKLLSNAAATFQYVGYAGLDKLSDNSKKIGFVARESYSPNPQGVISSWYNEIVESLSASLEESRTELQLLNKERDNVVTELNSILNSKKFKSAQALAKLKKAIFNPKMFINKFKELVRSKN